MKVEVKIPDGWRRVKKGKSKEGDRYLQTTFLARNLTWMESDVGVDITETDIFIRKLAPTPPPAAALIGPDGKGVATGANALTVPPEAGKLVEEVADAGAAFGACSVTKMSLANPRIRVEKAQAAVMAEFTRQAALRPAPLIVAPVPADPAFPPGDFIEQCRALGGAVDFFRRLHDDGHQGAEKAKRYAEGTYSKILLMLSEQAQHQAPEGGT